MVDAISPEAKTGIDITAGGVTILSLLDYAPKVVAVFAAIWYIIQGYEYLKKKWQGRKKKNRRASDVK